MTVLIFCRDSSSRSHLKQSEVVLDDTPNVYKPKTQETRQTFDIILAFVQDAIGDQVLSDVFLGNIVI